MPGTLAKAGMLSPLDRPRADSVAAPTPNADASDPAPIRRRAESESELGDSVGAERVTVPRRRRPLSLPASSACEPLRLKAR